jgi:hypothetical protein
MTAQGEGAKNRKFRKCKGEWRRDRSGEVQRAKLMKKVVVKERIKDKRCARRGEYQQEEIKIKTRRRKSRR